MNRYGIDHNDPRKILEEQEARTNEPSEDEILRECADRFGRVLFWLISGNTLMNIGERTLIAAKKLRPELIDGAAFDAIARPQGKGRSATHKLAMEFEAIFGAKSVNDKSQSARKHCADSWATKHKK